MSDTPDLDALVREWKEIDMKPIELALDTGRLRSSASHSLWFMTGLSLMLVSMWICWMFVVDVPLEARLAVGGCFGLFTAVFLWFYWRQLRAVRHADSLLTGTPAQMVRGRSALLETELFAWSGPAARFFELWVGPGLFLVLVGMAWVGVLSWFAPVAAGLFFIGFSAYGRLLRVPKLTSEMAELEALAERLDG